MLNERKELLDRLNAQDSQLENMKDDIRRLTHLRQYYPENSMLIIEESKELSPKETLDDDTHVFIGGIGSHFGKAQSSKHQTLSPKNERLTYDSNGIRQGPKLMVNKSHQLLPEPKLLERSSFDKQSNPESRMKLNRTNNLKIHIPDS